MPLTIYWGYTSGVPTFLSYRSLQSITLSVTLGSSVLERSLAKAWQHIHGYPVQRFNSSPSGQSNVV